MLIEPIGTHTTTLHHNFVNGITVAAHDRPPIQVVGFGALGVPIPGLLAVPSMAMVGGNKAPDVEILRDGLALKAFRGTGASSKTEAAFFQMNIPPDYVGGQTPEFVAYWTHNIGAPTGAVRWFIDVTVAEGGGSGLFSAPETLTTIQAVEPQYTHHITAGGDMVPSQAFVDKLGPEAVILGRVYRDPAGAGDIFDEDAFLSFVGLRYLRGGGVS